jgi:nitrate reductase gamma subunit
MSGLQLICYLAVVFFVVVVAAKMIRIARMPIHIRWDLYPIPHEKGRNSYGGSYYEEVDWWTKPTQVSNINELKEMAKEIVFIQSVFHHNKPLWVFSFPFHFGMYCLVGFTVMIILGAILSAAGVEMAAGSTGATAVIVHYLTVILGAAGFILGALGGIGLLFSRMSGDLLRKASVLSDYVNLVFLLAVFVSAIVTWSTVDPGFALLRGLVQSLITVRPAGPIPTALAVQVWLMVALLFYFPFTHMTHMFGKYFTYHKIRWEDHPNIRGGKIEKQVEEALGYKITWGAPHIKSGGSWAEACTDWAEDDKNE